MVSALQGGRKKQGGGERKKAEWVAGCDIVWSATAVHVVANDTARVFQREGVQERRGKGGGAE